MPPNRARFKKVKPGEGSLSHTYRNLPDAVSFDAVGGVATRAVYAELPDVLDDAGVEPLETAATPDRMSIAGFPTLNNQINSLSASGSLSAESALFYGSLHSSTEALQDLLTIFRRHNSDKSTQADFLWFLNKYLPQNHTLPPSIYMLAKHLDDFRICPVPEYYCTAHMEYLGQSSSPECADCLDDSAKSAFSSFDLSSTVSQLLEDPVVSALMKRAVPAGYLDIKHGRRYKELKKGPDANATFLFWYDGTDLKGDRASMWLLLWTIVELPIECRWDMARYSVILCSKSKPKAQIVLALFVRQSLNAVTLGVPYTGPQGTQETCSVNVLCACCDAPARCDGRGSRQWNSKEYGCTTCLRSGKWWSTTVYPYIHGPKPATRTHAQVLSDARDWAKARMDAAAAGAPNLPGVGARGTNGYSELLRFPSDIFDVVRGMPHEIMHIFMNLGKQLMTLLRTTDLHTLPYATLNPIYCSGRKRFLNDFEAHLLGDAMEQITFPSAYHRIPRANPKDWSDYKSSEFMFWMMVVLPFIFQKRGDPVDDILPPDVRKLLLTLSYSVHYLLCDRYDIGSSPTDVINRRADVAQRLVDDFAHQATKFFGAANITYAFHQLQHVPANYRDLGPAYAWSAFGWESLIGVAKKMQQGTNKAQQEITNKVTENQAVRAFLSRARDVAEVQGLGLPASVDSLQGRERASLQQALNARGLESVAEFKVYKRLAFRKYFRAETVDARRTSGHSDSTFRVSTGQIVAFTSFVSVKVENQTNYFAVGDVVTGSMRTSVPIPWRESGIPNASSISLELPKLYRNVEAREPTTLTVPVDHVEFPVFMLKKPTGCLVQYEDTCHQPPHDTMHCHESPLPASRVLGILCFGLVVG